MGSGPRSVSSSAFSTLSASLVSLHSVRSGVARGQWQAVQMNAVDGVRLGVLVRLDTELIVGSCQNGSVLLHPWGMSLRARRS